MDPSLLNCVSDPSDFPVDSLRKLDSSLRCTICKDFFDGPVVLHCGHTFCSLCIRTALPREPKCPTCLATAKETHLVRNVIFEEAVTAWSNARTLVLKFSKESVEPRHTRPTATSKKRKLSHNSAHEASTPKPARSGSSRSSRFEGEEESEEESHRPRKRAQSAIDEEVVPSSDPEEQELSNPAQSNHPVKCPACEQLVPFNFINAHIDSGCKTHLYSDSTGASGRTKPDSRAAWGSIFNGRGKKASDTSNSKDSEIITEKVAKVSYDVMTLSGLRKILAEKGLSTHGEKAELEQRHRRWTAICNANLDRTERLRRTVGELKQQLQEAEDAASRPGPKQVKDGAEKAWTLKNKAQFAELIKHARPKAKGLETKTESLSRAGRQPSADPSSSSITQLPSSSDVIEID